MSEVNELLNAVRSAVADGNQSAAVIYVQRIVSKYPNSQEAIEARKLLERPEKITSKDIDESTNQFATANSEHMGESTNKFATANSIGSLLAGLGWIIALAGAVTAAVLGDSAGPMGVGLGCLILISGLIQVALGQLVQAVIAMANNTQAILSEVRKLNQG